MTGWPFCDIFGENLLIGQHKMKKFKTKRDRQDYVSNLREYANKLIDAEQNEYAIDKKVAIFSIIECLPEYLTQESIDNLVSKKLIIRDNKNSELYSSKANENSIILSKLDEFDAEKERPICINILVHEYMHCLSHRGSGLIKIDDVALEEGAVDLFAEKITESLQFRSVCKNLDYTPKFDVSMYASVRAFVGILDVVTDGAFLRSHFEGPQVFYDKFSDDDFFAMTEYMEIENKIEMAHREYGDGIDYLTLTGDYVVEREACYNFWLQKAVELATAGQLNAEQDATLCRSLNDYKEASTHSFRKLHDQRMLSKEQKKEFVMQTTKREILAREWYKSSENSKVNKLMQRKNKLVDSAYTYSNGLLREVRLAHLLEDDGATADPRVNIIYNKIMQKHEAMLLFERYNSERLKSSTSDLTPVGVNGVLDTFSKMYAAGNGKLSFLAIDVINEFNAVQPKVTQDEQDK